MKSNKRSSAVFILTHKRADNVQTLATLKRCNYTGKIYYIVDDEDPELEKYRQNFGSENILSFSKRDLIDKIDVGDNFKKLNSVIYARNACFDLAKQKGITHFVQLDDDYSNFNSRFNERLEYQHKTLTHVESFFHAMWDFLDETPTSSIAFGQGGDFFGGQNGPFGVKIWLKRKCMNPFFCRTDRRFDFLGLMNDDVNTYIRNGNLGHLFFTTNCLALEQSPTQQNEGGLTELYLDSGTYVKSFYTVLYAPSAVSISSMGVTERRLHHRTEWNFVAPKILRTAHRK